MTNVELGGAIPLIPCCCSSTIAGSLKRSAQTTSLATKRCDCWASRSAEFVPAFVEFGRRNVAASPCSPLTRNWSASIDRLVLGPQRARRAQVLRLGDVLLLALGERVEPLLELGDLDPGRRQRVGQVVADRLGALGDPADVLHVVAVGVPLRRAAAALHPEDEQDDDQDRERDQADQAQERREALRRADRRTRRPVVAAPASGHPHPLGALLLDGRRLVEEVELDDVVVALAHGAPGAATVPAESAGKGLCPASTKRASRALRGGRSPLERPRPRPLPAARSLWARAAPARSGSPGTSAAASTSRSRSSRARARRARGPSARRRRRRSFGIRAACARTRSAATRATSTSPTSTFRAARCARRCGPATSTTAARSRSPCRCSRGSRTRTSRGIVHRDVKPANVLLADGDGWDARLLDFGLALLQDEDTLTAIGDVPGTLAYISPERLRGEPVAARPPTSGRSASCSGRRSRDGTRSGTGRRSRCSRRSSPARRRSSGCGPTCPSRCSRPSRARSSPGPRTGRPRRASPTTCAGSSASAAPAGAAAARPRRRASGPPRSPAASCPPRRRRSSPAGRRATLPFYPESWAPGLAAAAAALTLAHGRIGLVFALAVPFFPLANVSLGLALAYAAAALAWLALAWRDPRSGLLFAVGPLLAPLAGLGLLPLAVQPARGAMRKAATAAAGVLLGAVVAGIRHTELPLGLGAAPLGLGVAGSERPTAVVYALWRGARRPPGARPPRPSRSRCSRPRSRTSAAAAPGRWRSSARRCWRRPSCPPRAPPRRPSSRRPGSPAPHCSWSAAGAAAERALDSVRAGKASPGRERPSEHREQDRVPLRGRVRPRVPRRTSSRSSWRGSSSRRWTSTAASRSRASTSRTSTRSTSRPADRAQFAELRGLAASTSCRTTSPSTRAARATCCCRRRRSSFETDDDLELGEFGIATRMAQPGAAGRRTSPRAQLEPGATMIYKPRPQPTEAASRRGARRRAARSSSSRSRAAASPVEKRRRRDRPLPRVRRPGRRPERLAPPLRAAPGGGRRTGSSTSTRRTGSR